MDIFKTIGSDPEFFCYDTESKKYIALCNIISGDKDNPDPIDECPGCFQQVDNVAAEFTIPPCETIDEIYSYINSCKSCVTGYLKSINNNWELKAISSANFDDEQLCSDQAQMFGCAPSISLYNYEPSREISKNIRTAGFHLHFGWDGTVLSEENTAKFIFACDLTLGINSKLLDKDNTRENIYGFYGDYRIQPWGLEYRTPGADFYNHFEKVKSSIEELKYVISHKNFDDLFDKFFSSFLTINSLTKSQIIKLKKQCTKFLSTEH